MAEDSCGAAMASPSGGVEILWLFGVKRHLPRSPLETCEYAALASPDPVPLREAAGTLESARGDLVAIEEMGTCLAEADLRGSDPRWIRPVVFEVWATGSPSAEHVAIPERREDRMAPMTESIRKIARIRRIAMGRDTALMSVRRLGPVLLARGTGESGADPTLLPLIEYMREWCRRQSHLVLACHLSKLDGRPAFFVSPKSGALGWSQFSQPLARLLAELSIELNAPRGTAADGRWFGRLREHARECEQAGIGIGAELRQVPLNEADMFFPETAILVYGIRR